MIVQWIFFLIAGLVPEFETEPFSIATHLIAESSTAIALIISGIGLLKGVSWSREVSLIASGMLLYAIINSSGYFAQSGEWFFLGMFIILFFFSIISIIRVMRSFALSK
jgi:hypothetical protein